MAVSEARIHSAAAASEVGTPRRASTEALHFDFTPVFHMSRQDGNDALLRRDTGIQVEHKWRLADLTMSICGTMGEFWLIIEAYMWH